MTGSTTARFSFPAASSSESPSPGAINNPEIILADEPTGNLDSATEKEIMDLLTQLNREGRTIIMVTHETSVARRARRQIVMKDGVIASVGFFGDEADSK